MAQKDQLAVPGEALHDPKSLELLRVWIANGNQHVSLRTGVWEDPAAWELMLADLARHVLNIYRPATALDRDQILNRIKLGFEAELQVRRTHRVDVSGSCEL